MFKTYQHEFWTVTSGDLTQRRTPLTIPAVVDDPGEATKIIIDPTVKQQDWLGAGAAITDSAAKLLWENQSAAQRHALLTELFDPSQGGFSSIRVPLGSCDFQSQDYYTYDDVPMVNTTIN